MATESGHAVGYVHALVQPEPDERLTVMAKTAHGAHTGPESVQSHLVDKLLAAIDLLYRLRGSLYKRQERTAKDTCTEFLAALEENDNPYLKDAEVEFKFADQYLNEKMIFDKLTKELEQPKFTGKLGQEERLSSEHDTLADACMSPSLSATSLMSSTSGPLKMMMSPPSTPPARMSGMDSGLEVSMWNQGP